MEKKSKPTLDRLTKHIEQLANKADEYHQKNNLLPAASSVLDLLLSKNASFINSQITFDDSYQQFHFYCQQQALLNPALMKPLLFTKTENILKNALLQFSLQLSIYGGKEDALTKNLTNILQKYGKDDQSRIALHLDDYLSQTKPFPISDAILRILTVYQHKLLDASRPEDKTVTKKKHGSKAKAISPLRKLSLHKNDSDFKSKSPTPPSVTKKNPS